MAPRDWLRRFDGHEYDELPIRRGVRRFAGSSFTGRAISNGVRRLLAFQAGARSSEAEHLHRFDPRRAPGRKPAGEERDGDQHERCQQKRQTVVSGETIEKAVQHPARRHRSTYAEDGSGAYDRRALPNDQRQNLPAPCSQCHADRYLAAALFHRVALDSCSCMVVT